MGAVEMNKTRDLRLRTLVDNISELLSGVKHETDSAIKVNRENLSRNGELVFLANLKAWRNILANRLDDNAAYTDILEYFLARRGIEFKDRIASEKAFEELVLRSKDWPLRIEKCALQKEKVCLFLNRTQTFAAVIEQVTRNGYMGPMLKEEYFYLTVDPDKDSELTSWRLNLIRDVSENILKAQGHIISESHAENRYILTVKSQSSVKRDYKILLCGVVKNSETKSKETVMKPEDYLAEKLNGLLESTEHKFPTTKDQEERYNLFLKRIAKAIIAVELLAVKPSHTVSVGTELDSSRSVANTKGATFILYNTARIAAILRKFEEEQSLGNYPSLTDIGAVNFCLLDQEEEWELLFNFVLGYPEMLQNCVRHGQSFEVCPHNVCSFLLQLCKKFSAYYRRVRVLTEGRDHLIPTMMARLYLLKCLQDVLHRALALLNIDPVSQM